ncbi:MAG TPA: DAK2 domain-containing protein, partial [Candidatus Nanopelagicales bacterium]|nr:DAK2 domain-containing protein [Candidatus Nanopelagicales bacterium]
AAVGEALAHGALLGARGNSGIILSQLTRGFVTGLADSAGLPRAAAVAVALQLAARGAYEAVATPVEGTVLTVARVAAERAAEVAGRLPDDLPAVVRAARDGARDALAQTPQQLAVLARAGVVDSGGRGLVVLYEALDEVVSGVRRVLHPGPLPVPVPAADREPEEYTGGAYEVMYLLEAGAEAGPVVRDRLAELGDSVVVVGSSGLWNVHVHTDDVGPAIEAGIVAGRPYRIQVTNLTSAGDHRAGTGRAVVVVTHGPGTATVLAGAGATTVPALPGQAPSTEELLDGVRRTGVAEVVLLTSDSDTRPAAEAAAREARQQRIRVAVIPTRSIVQSLAAVAVHDAGAEFDDAVIAMTRAAHATRYAAVTTAVREAITMAGTCRPGDILGVMDGDVAEIGTAVPEVSASMVERLLGSGGELVTLVTGEGAEPGLVEGVRRQLRRDHPGVELVSYDGGQPHWPLIVGVE